MHTLLEAHTPQHIPTVRALFGEYAAWLGFDLCFQNFAQELADLPGGYAPPTGRLFLALVDGEPAGCIALCRIDMKTCEMKRLFVRPAFRGRGIGESLTRALITAAREIGYARMRLDTLPTMTSALKLYRALGFGEIAPYRYNPIPGAIYMELELLATGGVPPEAV